MDYWTLIRRLLMEWRTVISFQVTHADIQLVFSQSKTINLDPAVWQLTTGD